MSIYAGPGSTATANLDGAPTGLVGTMGIQVLDNKGAVVIARTTAGIVEAPAGSGSYIATLTAPSTAGTYVVVWDDGSISPTTTATEELIATSTAPVASTPSGADLCTLSEVRALMQKKTSDTAQDSLIQALIHNASNAIMRFTDREFAPQSTNVTRQFEFPWEGEFLSLAPYDLRDVRYETGGEPETKVKVDTRYRPGSGIELSIEEFDLYPNPPRDGTYTAIRVRPFSAKLGRIMWRNRQVQITGNWGFPAIPDDVSYAAALTVVHWMTVNTAWFRRPDDDPNITHFPKRGIPPEAFDLLSRYKRGYCA